MFVSRCCCYRGGIEKVGWNGEVKVGGREKVPKRTLGEFVLVRLELFLEFPHVGGVFVEENLGGGEGVSNSRHISVGNSQGDDAGCLV